MSPQQFIEAYAPTAQEAQKETGVPASITLAQAALESGWGAHAPGNNFFGIKPGQNWTGKIQYIDTTECGRTGIAHQDGIYDEVTAIYPPNGPNHSPLCPGKYTYKVKSKFRAYDTPAGSFADHGNFLKINKRYAPCFATTTAEDFATALQKCGYSTAPNYAEILIQIIHAHKLEEYDK